MQKPIFRTIESKNVSYLRLWLSATLISYLILSAITMLIMSIMPPSFIFSIPLTELLLLIVLSTIILNTLICEGRKYYLQKSKTQYTKVIINNTGIIFTNEYNQTIIAKILWKNIQHRIHEKFDIDLIFSNNIRRPVPYFLWNLSESSDSKIPQWSDNQFARMFAKFTNKDELLKTFFKGITSFRSDITINPELFRFYKLDPNTLEKDIVLLKKIHKLEFFIVLFSIIVTLIITFLMFMFS